MRSCSDAQVGHAYSVHGDNHSILGGFGMATTKKENEMVCEVVRQIDVYSHLYKWVHPSVMPFLNLRNRNDMNSKSRLHYIQPSISRFVCWSYPTICLYQLVLISEIGIVRLTSMCVVQMSYRIRPIKRLFLKKIVF